MVKIEVDDILEPFDYEIAGLCFKKDRRYNQRDGFYISVWDGSKWLFIERLVPYAGNIKKIMLRAGKEALGQILSVDYKKVYPNTNLPDLEGELFKKLKC